MCTRAQVVGILSRSAKSFTRLRYIIPVSAPPVGPAPLIVYDLPAELQVRTLISFEWHTNNHLVRL